MSEEEDKPKWLWNKNGIFSVKSIYSHLFVEDPDLPNKKLWRAKIPLKIKTFMWLISRNAILTKDKFLKRKWQGDTKCRFCPELETISHMFFEYSMAKFVWSLVAMVVGSSCRPCSYDQFWEWVQKYMPTGSKFHMVGLAAICWAIWRAHNNICFENKLIRWDRLFGLILSCFLGRTPKCGWLGDPGSGSWSSQIYGTSIPPSYGLC